MLANLEQEKAKQVALEKKVAEAAKLRAKLVEERRLAAKKKEEDDAIISLSELNIFGKIVLLDDVNVESGIELQKLIEKCVRTDPTVCSDIEAMKLDVVDQVVAAQIEKEKRILEEKRRNEERKRVIAETDRLLRFEVGGKSYKLDESTISGSLTELTFIASLCAKGDQGDCSKFDERKIIEVTLFIERIAEEKRKKEEEEARILEQKRIAEEKRKKEEEARILEQKRIAEEKRITEEKRKKIKARIAEEKRIVKEARKIRVQGLSLEAKAIYLDVMSFIKNGGDFDLFELTLLFDKRPVPLDEKKNLDWTETEEQNYVLLRNFVFKNQDFQKFYKSQKLKRASLLSDDIRNTSKKLNSYKNDLKVIVVENFGSELATSLIALIKEIDETLEDLNKDNLADAKFLNTKIEQKILAITKQRKQLDENLIFFENAKIKLRKHIQNNFGTDQASIAASLLKRLENVEQKSLGEHNVLRLKINGWINNVSAKETTSSTSSNSSSATSNSVQDSPTQNTCISSDKFFFETCSPPEQKYMNQLIVKVSSEVDGKSDAFKKRKWIEYSNELCSSKKFNAFDLKVDWVGELGTVLMRDDGSVFVEIDIDDRGGFFDVLGNEVHDANINKGLEDTVLTLSDKQKVKFSGKFSRGKKSENECLRAGVFDANPEFENEAFEFKLTKIEAF